MPHMNVTEYQSAAPVSPVRFALVTDLHDRAAEQVGQAILDAAPDAVLIAGDLFEAPPRRRTAHFGEALRLLDLLRSIPTFYVGGNHDSTLPPRMEQAMRERRVELLFDRAVPFRDLFIGGVRSAQYAPGKKPNTAFLDAFSAMEGYKILLCHHPEYYPRFIRGTRIDLTLSGHAHGGQWTLFGRGVYAPGQGLFPRYTAGLYEGRLLVSRGLKISRPIPRIGNPRELPILCLSPSASAASPTP
jgi:hypothetical protein